MFVVLALAGTAVVAEVDPLPVAEILAADRIRLGDGREVVLAGIDVPDGEVALRARRLVERLLAGGARLAPEPAVRDRYGRLMAQLETDDGRWLQGELLAAGLARVATRPDQRARAGEMLAREAQARAAGRGLWADPAHRVRQAQELGPDDRGFHVVEGMVLAVNSGRRYLYLDFGSDWRRDFALRLPLAGRRAFSAGSGPAVEDLVGKRVRVRGYLVQGFGPAIELSHPEQIEVLE